MKKKYKTVTRKFTERFILKQMAGIARINHRLAFDHCKIAIATVSFDGGMFRLCDFHTKEMLRIIKLAGMTEYFRVIKWL